MNTQNTPKNFEDGMSELESLVRTLEDGRMPLEAALSAFERGTFLRRYCEEKLMSAKMKVDQISKDSDGQVILKSFDTSSGT